MAEKEKPTKKKHTDEKAGITNNKQAKLAVIRVRGLPGLPNEYKDTLQMLHLHKRNFCSVFDSRPEIVGMLKKVKDIVTWGEIDEETLKLLKEKREVEGKKFYRLNPPIKGFGRKGIKVSFKNSGALGYRGDKINDLIKRMV